MIACQLWNCARFVADWAKARTSENLPNPCGPSARAASAK
jgi:hypothetical protein